MIGNLLRPDISINIGIFENSSTSIIGLRRIIPTKYQQGIDQDKLDGQKISKVGLSKRKLHVSCRLCPVILQYVTKCSLEYIGYCICDVINKQLVWGAIFRSIPQNMQSNCPYSLVNEWTCIRNYWKWLKQTLLDKIFNFRIKYSLGLDISVSL